MSPSDRRMLFEASRWMPRIPNWAVSADESMDRRPALRGILCVDHKTLADGRKRPRVAVARCLRPTRASSIDHSLALAAKKQGSEPV